MKCLSIYWPLTLTFFLVSWAGNGLSQYSSLETATSSDSTDNKIRLIIRLDDMGFCHAVNMACERIFNEGVATAVSVMVTTPWLDEAAEILRRHPEISVGVHLTLNSEWREFRWGPVMPYSEVPSLVDAFGKFYGSRREFMLNRPKIREVEKELRAQIELALRKGLNISYIDNHMGTAISTLEFQEIMEKLANEYHLGISRYFGEFYAPNTYSVAPEKKLETGIKIIEELTSPGIHLLVVHPGTYTPEMAVLTDLNAFGLKEMAKHRQAEADMLCHPDFKSAIQRRGIELIGYNQLKAEGLHLMRRPFTAEKYDVVLEKTLKEFSNTQR